MSAPPDALAVLLEEAVNDPKLALYFPSHGVALEVQAKMIASYLTRRGVVVLAPDHPLRTGRESEEMFAAGRKAFDVAIRSWYWDEAFRQALRAALAVLREGQ